MTHIENKQNYLDLWIIKEPQRPVYAQTQEPFNSLRT